MDRKTFATSLAFAGGLLLTLPAQAAWDDVEDGAEDIGSAVERQWERFEDWVSPEDEEERREEAQERREDAREEADEEAAKRRR